MTTQSIPPIESPTSQYYSRAEALQTLNQLGQALQSGNLAQARADYTDFQEHSPAPFRHGSTPAGQAFEALGSALQSGSVSDAQQAFQALAQTLYKQSHGAEPLTPDAGSSQDVASTSGTPTAGLDATA